MYRFIRLILFCATIFCGIAGANAEYAFEVGGELNLGAGSSDFAPLYLRADRHGKVTQSKNVQFDIWASDPLDLSKRFDFSWGLEVVGGYANKADYRRWNAELNTFEPNMQGPAPIWIQQLYGEVKWRSLFLRVGLKDFGSCFVDQRLSSGDLIWSGNSRGIPEVRAGFVDFQNIPFTKGWVQIDACISYGKFMDTKWVNNHFDYWEGKRNPGGFWTYKRGALRTKPSKPFSFQAGFQMAGIFGGKSFRYRNGVLETISNNYTGVKDFFQMFLPIWGSETEGYRVGDAKGSWDAAARYRFKNGETVRAYFQWPWEDSTGIDKRNGFDGLWGLEFKMNRRWWVNGAVVEYLDLTHMAGPIAYDPQYQPDATLPYKVDGADGYYNNYYYRSYVNYGLNMGTPMVMGILFNTGYEPHNLNNDQIQRARVRGIHVAIEGAIGPDCDYIVKYSHRKAWGMTNTYALIYPGEADSFMAEASYRLHRVPGLTLKAAVGVDHGNLPGNAAGGMLTISYERPILFK